MKLLTNEEIDEYQDSDPESPPKHIRLLKLKVQAKLSNAQADQIKELEDQNTKFSRELSRQMQGWHKANEKIKGLQSIIDRAEPMLKEWDKYNIHYLINTNKQIPWEHLKSLLLEIRGLK